MSPREFWRLTLPELLWLVEAKTPPKVLFSGPKAMTEDEARQIALDTYGDE